MNANAQAPFQAIMELDLSPIKTKLMHVASGEGWSLDKANAVEKEYRRFLCLMKLYPEAMIAPLVDVDTFWHYHILDTMKYARDCDQAFGYFAHHYPYVGLADDEEQVRLDSGERMRTLYEATFGDAYPVSFDTHGTEAAFCAGPTPQAAFCAGPTPQVAFCAGPTPQDASRAAQVAFCAGPTPQVAFCAGPTPQVAFCAGPTPQGASRAATMARTGAQPLA